jgi:hypothetical protein
MKIAPACLQQHMPLIIAVKDDAAKAADFSTSDG